MNESQKNVSLATRAKNVYDRMMEDGFNPADHTDHECNRYRNLGAKTLPYLRAISEKDQHTHNKAQLPDMSLRDWFAGQALAGLLASGVMRDLGDVQPGDGLFGHHRAAKLAMLAADAMLSEREKGGAA